MDKEKKRIKTDDEIEEELIRSLKRRRIREESVTYKQSDYLQRAIYEQTITYLYKNVNLSTLGVLLILMKIQQQHAVVNDLLEVDEDPLVVDIYKFLATIPINLPIKINLYRGMTVAKGSIFGKQLSELIPRVTNAVDFLTPITMMAGEDDRFWSFSMDFSTALKFSQCDEEDDDFSVILCIPNVRAGFRGYPGHFFERELILSVGTKYMIRRIERVSTLASVKYTIIIDNVPPLYVHSKSYIEGRVKEFIHRPRRRADGYFTYYSPSIDTRYELWKRELWVFLNKPGDFKDTDIPLAIEFLARSPRTFPGDIEDKKWDEIIMNAMEVNGGRVMEDLPVPVQYEDKFFNGFRCVLIDHIRDEIVTGVDFEITYRLLVCVKTIFPKPRVVPVGEFFTTHAALQRTGGTIKFRTKIPRNIMKRKVFTEDDTFLRKNLIKVIKDDLENPVAIHTTEHLNESIRARTGVDYVHCYKHLLNLFRDVERKHLSSSALVKALLPAVDTDNRDLEQSIRSYHPGKVDVTIPIVIGYDRLCGLTEIDDPRITNMIRQAEAGL